MSSTLFWASWLCLYMSEIAMSVDTLCSTMQRIFPFYIRLPSLCMYCPVKSREGSLVCFTFIANEVDMYLMFIHIHSSNTTHTRLATKCNLSISYVYSCSLQIFLSLLCMHMPVPWILYMLMSSKAFLQSTWAKTREIDNKSDHQNWQQPMTSQ